MRALVLRGALVAVAALAVATPAHAESIAYVKDGDVWLTTPDGTRQHRVTATGGYASVSQADDGTMVALAGGERLRRLSRTGEVLADFATMVSDGSPQPGPVTKFHGPFEPQISPDGTKVAFEWFNDSYEETPGCSAQTVPPCAVYSQRQGVAISWADRYTGPEAFGLMTGWIFPQWLSETTLVRSFSGATMNDDAVLTTVAPGGADRQLDPWMYDDDRGYGVDDVEVSRDAHTVVGIAGDDERLRVYRTRMAPFGAPDWDHRPFAQGNQPVVERCAELTGPAGGRFSTPSLAPDGRGLAYGDAEGVWVTPLPDLAAGCQPGIGRGRLLVPGARGADWGPANVPAPQAAPPGSGAGAGAQPPTGPAAGPRPSTRRLQLVTRSLRAALRSGLVVRVDGPRARRVVVTASRSGRVVGRGTARAGRARTTVRLRFTPAARRALRRAHTATLVLRGLGTPVRVTLRR